MKDKFLIYFHTHAVFIILLVIFCLVLCESNLVAQENRSFGIGTDLIKLNYENLANETFEKIWDDTADQRIKIPLIEGDLDVNLTFGGSVVPIEEMLEIPELKKLFDEGKFPLGKFYIKHQCQLSIKGALDINSFLRAGLELPYKVSFIECVDEEKGKAPKLIKRKAIHFLINYIKMIHNRFDKGFGAFEDSILHNNIALEVGERISIERFILVSAGIGKPGLGFSLNNPILKIKGQAQFTLLDLSRVLGHEMYTIQNFGDMNRYRVTATKKRVLSIEFLSIEFGFEFKTIKKLLEIGRLKVDINLIRFKPTFEKYKFTHNQYYADFSKDKMFRHFKRINFLGFSNFLKYKRDDVVFYRSFVINGHDYYNNINWFNFYKNNRLERVENRFIDVDFNRRENIGFGQFRRFKRVFVDSVKLNCELYCDYTFLRGADNDSEDHSGFKINVDSLDHFGLTDLKKAYMGITKYILGELINEPISELDMIYENKSKEQFVRKLSIEIGANGFLEIFKDKNNFFNNIQNIYDVVSLKLPQSKSFYLRLSTHLEAMLHRIVNRFYKMNEVLLYNFETSKQRYFSFKKVVTPGQLPLREVYFLILALAYRDYVHVVYEVEKIEKKTSVDQPKVKKAYFKFEYFGKNFKSSADKLNFHY